MAVPHPVAASNPELIRRVVNEELALLADPLLLKEKGVVLLHRETRKSISIRSLAELPQGRTYVTPSGCVSVSNESGRFSIAPSPALQPVLSLAKKDGQFGSSTPSSNADDKGQLSSGPHGDQTRGTFRLESASDPHFHHGNEGTEEGSNKGRAGGGGETGGGGGGGGATGERAIPPLLSSKSWDPKTAYQQVRRNREVRYSSLIGGPSVSVECAIESTDPNVSHLCPICLDIRAENALGEAFSLTSDCHRIRWERSTDPSQKDSSFQPVETFEGRLFQPCIIDVDTYIRAVVDVQSSDGSDLSQPTNSLKVALDLDVQEEVAANVSSRCAVFKVASKDERIKDEHALLVLFGGTISIRSRHHKPFIACRFDEPFRIAIDRLDPQQFYVLFPDAPPLLLRAGSIFQRDVIVLTIQTLITSSS